MNVVKSATALLLLCLTLSACLRVEAEIIVDDDGGGQVSLLYAIDTESVTGTMADLDVPDLELGSTAEICDDFVADNDMNDLPESAEVSAYRDGGFCGVQATFDLEPSTSHDGTLESVFEDSDSRLYKEDDNWFFETAVTLDDELESETDGVPPEIFNAFFSGASFTIVVDLPGTPVEGAHNATSVTEDGRFEWDIDIFDPPDRLFAQTEPAGVLSGGGLLRWILIGLGVLLLGALAWFLLRRRGAVRANAEHEVAHIDTSSSDAMPPTTEPVPRFDSDLGLWVIDDETQGRLAHDPASNTWRPV